MMDTPLEHRRLPVHDVHLHVVQAGPIDGPLVILLHGFPEFWYGWRHQIGALAAAGFRVWAPDQRGYNLSDRPAGVAAYKMDALSADVLGLVEASGREKVFLAGHDWGGNVAWWFARLHPERLARLAILNVPHGSVMAHYLRHNPAQQRRSVYIGFFQIPWLPEVLFRPAGWRLLVEGMTRTARPGTFSPEELAHYRQAWSQPGAMTAMINWYRAVARYRPQGRPDRRITVPTLVIWGAQDQFFEPETAGASVELCDDGRLVMLESASHWLHHEEPDRINGLLIDFFGA
jgi:epoxide hydrolase 4